MATQKHAIMTSDTVANTRTNADAKQFGQLSDNSDTNTTTAQAEAFHHVNAAGTLLLVHPIYKTINKSSGAETLLDIEFGSIYVNTSLYPSEYIYHLGDTDTFIRFQTDRQDYNAGAVNFLSLIEDTQDLFEVNAGNADIDFIVNSAAGDNALVVIGSSGYVGIGTSTSDYKFQTLYTTSATATRQAIVAITAKSTGDMTDGFGPAIRFLIDDDADTPNLGAVIATARDGSDTSCRLTLGTYESGVLTDTLILNAGNSGFGVTDPDTKVEIFNAGTQLKLSFNAGDYATLGVDDDNILTIGNVTQISTTANIGFTTAEFIAVQSTNTLTIRGTTSDASDDLKLTLASGGDAANTRGAYINLYGNESVGNTGNAYIIAGLGGNVNFYLGDASGANSLNILDSSVSPMVKIDSDGSLFINEKAAASADVAGFGQLWVKTATPNELWFTDDAGTDHQIAFVT